MVVNMVKRARLRQTLVTVYSSRGRNGFLFFAEYNQWTGIAKILYIRLSIVHCVPYKKKVCLVAENSVFYL